MSQQALARVAGVDESIVAAIEAAEHDPPLRMQSKLFCALGAPANDFYEGIDWRASDEAA